MKNVSSGGSQILGGLGLAQAVPPHPSPLPQGEGWGEGEGRVEPAGSSRGGPNDTDSRCFLIANLDSGGASKRRTHHKTTIGRAGVKLQVDPTETILKGRFRLFSGFEVAQCVPPLPSPLPE